MSLEEILDASAMLHLLRESLIDSVHPDAVREEYSFIVEYANQMTSGNVATAFHSFLPTLQPSREGGTLAGRDSVGNKNGSGENDFR